MSLTVKDSEQLILDMMGAVQYADRQVAEENRRAQDTFTKLFQKMQQTMEQQSAEIAALRIQLMAAETRNSEAQMAHQAMVRELNGQIDAARTADQEKEQLHQKQVAALEKQMDVITKDRDEAKRRINEMVPGIDLLRRIAASHRTHITNPNRWRNPNTLGDLLRLTGQAQSY